MISIYSLFDKSATRGYFKASRFVDPASMMLRKGRSFSLHPKEQRMSCKTAAKYMKSLKHM